jgi:hypothetical protein
MTSFARFVLATLFTLCAAALYAADATDKKTPPKYGCDLLTQYVPLAKALAADDFAAAKTAAAALSQQAISNGLTGIVEKAKVVAEAADITKARAAFRPLSEEIEPLTVTEKNVTVMYCPMAKGSWVQDTGPVENPYYGKSMLRCGAPKVAAK